jgi:hypothetical protein
MLVVVCVMAASWHDRDGAKAILLRATRDEQAGLEGPVEAG